MAFNYAGLYLLFMGNDVTLKQVSGMPPRCVMVISITYLNEV